QTLRASRWAEVALWRPAAPERPAHPPPDRRRSKTVRLQLHRWRALTTAETELRPAAWAAAAPVRMARPRVEAAPAARPRTAREAQVEEAANAPVPVGATPRSERIRRQARAPRASPTSGPARLRGQEREREARREQHPSSATSTAGSTPRPATPEIPTRPAQAWPAPAPPTPRFRGAGRPSWGRPPAAGPGSGGPRWRPRPRAGSAGPPAAHGAA